MGHAYTARQFCLATFAAIIGPAISGSAADLSQRGFTRSTSCRLIEARSPYTTSTLVIDW